MEALSQKHTAKGPVSELRPSCPWALCIGGAPLAPGARGFAMCAGTAQGGGCEIQKVSAEIISLKHVSCINICMLLEKGKIHPLT